MAVSTRIQNIQTFQELLCNNERAAFAFFKSMPEDEKQVLRDDLHSVVEKIKAEEEKKEV